MFDLKSRVNGKGSQWLPPFLDFISRIKIKSKELTEPGPIVPYGSQELLLKGICDALDEDCHFIAALKARQLGASSILWALDIFWLSLWPGLDGALILDSADNLAVARNTIKEMLESLPRSHRVDVKQNNRDFLALANGSRLQYIAAGKRSKNSTLGISRAYSFAHLSELGAFGDPNAVKHLITTFAQKNPNRLYILESTAFGFNGWHDIYEDCEKDGVFTRAIFIGWWAKEIYSHERGSREFVEFWDKHPHFTAIEREKMRIVKGLYNVTITEEQIAWYRSMERTHSDAMMAEKYPWYAKEAFVHTGKGFFSNKRMTEDMSVVKNIAFAGYICKLGKTFMDLEVVPAPENTKPADIDLRVWSEPRRGAHYCMGVDPAYGSSEKADRTVITIWRAYADKLIQVAEYATPEPSSGQAAWVMAYLAACYKDVFINIELNGPGEAVFREIQHLKQQMRVGQIAEVAGRIKVGSALDSMRWFLDRKVIDNSRSFAFNFKTNLAKKNTMFNQFRDSYNYEALIPRSVPLLGEMKKIFQDGDHISPAAEGKDKDDRVFAACLAHKVWADQMRASLMADGETFMRASQREQQQDANPMRVENVQGAVMVHDFFRKKRAEATENAMRKLRQGI